MSDDRPFDSRTETIRRFAARARTSRAAAVSPRIAAIQRLTSAAGRTFKERSAEALASLEDALRATEADGAPPPLLRLAQRSSEEKPYNRYLGWLLDPGSGHTASRPALRALAQALSFDALLDELGRDDVDVEVRCEKPWPDEARSTKEPDLLVAAPRRQPRAILLLENKVGAGESGDQYGPYREALARLVDGHQLRAEASRAYLLAPEERSVPVGWDGVLSHAWLASVLQGVASDPSVATWDRALAYLVAEAFLHQDGTGAKSTEMREIHSRTRLTHQPTLRDLRRISELLPLPPPFRWRLGS